MEEYFSVLEKLNPGIIRRKIVGKSFEGRNISLFIISSPKIGVKCNPDNKVKNNKLATKNESWISELNNFNNNWQLDGRDNLRYKREFEIRTNSRINRAENRPNRNVRIPRKSERRILLNGTNTHNFIYIHSGLLKNVKTSNNKSRNGGKLSTSKPIIFIDGGLHSREWVCPAVALYFIQKLLNTPSLISNDRFWRKTRSKSADSDCYGADMNRNFNHHWGANQTCAVRANGSSLLRKLIFLTAFSPAEVDTSKNPCSEHYGGTGPNSEVETRVMRDVLIKQKHRLKAYVSLHSWGQQILYPYSYSELKLPSTMDEMTSSGTSADWVYDVLGVTYSYLIELRDKLGLLGFLLPDSFIKPTGEDLFTAMKYLSSEILKKENVTCHQK
ncbi:Carboxypeptidase B [Armadillidium vulgare]|nr:Carboxypeptidase B [Armadillidium vulgare]